MTQMLFYDKVVPVSSQRHRDLSIERVDFGFAAKVNSVPLTAVELPLAAREYTIVFAGTEEAVAPVVVLGVADSQNLYLDENKAWKADYIPAFVRRYPFVFAQGKDANQFTLCIDEDWSGCNREGRGQRLFDDQGNQTHVPAEHAQVPGRLPDAVRAHAGLLQEAEGTESAGADASSDRPARRREAVLGRIPGRQPRSDQDPRRRQTRGTGRRPTSWN